MNSICRQFGRILTISLISFLATATVLAFAPTNSLAFFHELGSGTKQVVPSPKPTPSPKVSPKPKVKAAKDKANGESFWSKLFKKSPKAAKPAPSPKVAKAEPKVKGAQDKKGGESAVGKFFKSIGRGLAAVGDFLWPFDGKTAKKEVKTGQAKASPASSPSPVAEQPKELAQTGEETAASTGSVTVAVPDEITNDTLTILGNLIWGDSTADRLTLKGLLASDLLLDKSKTYTLANSGERFKAGYFSDNVYIGDENRLGATGMNVKGSAYIETRSGGSIYLNPDSNNVYIGNSSNLEVAKNLTVKGTTTVTGGQTFTGDATFAGDIALNGGDLTTTAATFNLVDAATTVNLGATAVARTINIGTGTLADTVNIGTGATTANTVNIATGAVANTIAIGSASSTGVSITDDNWSITVAGLITTADDIALNGGDLTTTAATFNLVDAATTVNLGATAVARTINIGTGTLADTVNIGTGATTANTVNIATGAVANTIAIGSASSTTVSITDDNWSVSAAGVASFAGTTVTTLAASGDITWSAATPNIAINNTETLTITDGTNTLLSLADAGTTATLNLTGLASIGLGGTASTTAVCSALAGATAPTAGTAYEIRDCSGAPAADYAERYPVAAGSEFGDVMVIGTKQVTLTNGQVIPQLIKSSAQYQRGLVGVVSDNVGDFTSAGYNVPENENPMSVALVGRVPVKVSGEGGPIAEGDYLTTSSTSGHAMKATKAGPVVGLALGSFNGDKGTVMAFIKAAWYDPLEEQKQAVLAALGLGSGSVLGTSTSATSGSTGGTTTSATSPLVGAAADGSLGVLAEEVDLLVHGLLTANNLRVTTAAEFAGTLVVKGLATFEGDLVVKGAFSTGSLDLSGALTRTMTAGSNLSAGDPVVVTGANTVARAGGSSANVVGLAATSASAGSSVKVAVAGTVGGYSGLSTGARYYVGSGGVVTTAPGGDKAVHIGIAISGSEMIVQIFESAAPPAPPVVDTATVDTGPTVSVSGTTTTTSSSTTEPTPSPSPSPTLAPSPTPTPSPTPSPTLESSPTPAPSPSPSL